MNTNEKDAQPDATANTPTPSEPDHAQSDRAESDRAQSDRPAKDDLRSRGDNRSQRPSSEAFRAFISSGWDDTIEQTHRREVADFTPARRDALVQTIPHTRLVLPAGGLKVRSNDTDYAFRPHTAFAYYGGLGTDEEPDSVLVVEPSADDPEVATAIYFFRPRAGFDSDEFFADSRYGEMWVGRRPTLAEASVNLGIECRHIDELRDHLAKDLGEQLSLAVHPQVDARIEDMVAQVRSENGLPTGDDASADNDALAEAASEQRLLKDDYEITQMREAVSATIDGFERVIAELPAAVAHARGERVIEGVFARTARAEGNGVGYDTIAAAGDHACTLHWIRNDGPVREGDLVLIDAGVEVDSLYTADVTRTLPISGTFSPAQRQVYDAVLDAADQAFAFARPGVRFRDIHATAMKVIASYLEQWGLLPGTAEESLASTGQWHRRWMVHGTSHHLGMDVHDCAQARREMYLDAQLQPGMVFTIEPGLYFKANDLLVPEELRGIGVRIEDDILVTSDGVENLSARAPRAADDVEQWMRSLQA